MFDDHLDELEHGWNGYRRRRAERHNNKVHDNEGAKSIQERASDGIAAQERNSLGAQDKNAGNDKGYQEVNEYPEQGGGDSAFECGIAQYAAGDILRHSNKGGLSKDTINKPLLDYQLDDTDNHSAERNGTKERIARGEGYTAGSSHVAPLSF